MRCPREVGGVRRRHAGSARRAGAWIVAAAAILAACSASERELVDRSAQSPLASQPSTTTSEVPPGISSVAVDRHLFVAPWGSDDAAGTSSEPFETIAVAFERLRPGDTLTVREGRYREDVVLDEELRPGTAEAPIVVQAHPGERPVIEGRLALYDADHWTLRGINVTWSDRNDPDDHMVVFNGGRGFRFTDAEVWGARSFAAIVVGEGSRDFQLDHLYVHDTYPSNDPNQDHLVYLAEDAVGGVVEHNILVRSANGRGVKLGPGDLSDTGAHSNIIRYNTFYANEGPSNIQLSGDSSDNEIYGNLMVRPGPGSEAITAWRLTGRNNVVADNLAWDAVAVLERDPGLVDRGGNVMADPMFSAPEDGDFLPTNPVARAYGAHAVP